MNVMPEMVRSEEREEKEKTLPFPVARVMEEIVTPVNEKELEVEEMRGALERKKLDMELSVIESVPLPMERGEEEREVEEVSVDVMVIPLNVSVPVDVTANKEYESPSCFDRVIVKLFISTVPVVEIENTLALPLNPLPILKTAALSSEGVAWMSNSLSIGIVAVSLTCVPPIRLTYAPSNSVSFELPIPASTL